MLNMRRRQFISLLGGAAAAWPLVVRAQHPGKLPTIGFLGTTDPSSMRPWITAFVERLRDLGWIEDRTIAIAYRWAEGHPERYAEIAAEFVRLNVNVIVTTGPAAPQAKKATSVIPIVLVSARGVKTARGGEWTAVQVSDILRRAYRWAQLARSPPCAISCTWRSPPIPMALRAHSADCSRRLRP